MSSYSVVIADSTSLFIVFRSSVCALCFSLQSLISTSRYLFLACRAPLLIFPFQDCVMCLFLFICFLVSFFVVFQSALPFLSCRFTSFVLFVFPYLSFVHAFPFVFVFVFLRASQFHCFVLHCIILSRCLSFSLFT